MKTKAFRKKLVLNKKTIADLNMDKMKNALGGNDATEFRTGNHEGTSFCCTGPTGEPFPYCPACPIC